MCGIDLAKLFRKKAEPKADESPQKHQIQSPPQHGSELRPPVPAPRPSYKVIENLSNKIEHAYKQNNDSAKFLPYDQLAAFATSATVNSVLEDAGVHNANELSSFVSMHAKRLFLILVMMTEESEKISLLLDLKRSNITDKSLPITIEVNGDENGYSWSSLEADSESKKEFLGNWSRRDRDSFTNYQWRFLAPRFGKQTFRFKFHTSRTLPYLRASPKPASSGFFGEVSRVEIHKAHLDVASLPTLDLHNDEVSIAIKKAKHDEVLADFFDKEASNLHRLQQYKSPHLITPIAAYQKGEDRCLIFPWANGGNLLKYWSDFESQRSDLDSLRWILDQIKGVCSALEELHEENTRHGDLKPENILWFQDEKNHGIFQIADLGLAAFHEKEEHTKNRKGMMTFTPSGTSRYEPPEMDETRETHDARSRQYDIWSMGCILLELLIWLIYGYESVVKFKVSTTHFWESYDIPDGKKYTIHPYVDSCMNVMMSDLESHSNGASAYKDLLSLIRKRLLVVKVSEIYESYPDYRETAKALHMAITDIVHKSESHISYLAAVQLKYPGDRISSQQRHNTVYKEGGGLAAPRRDDAPTFPSNLTVFDNPSIDEGGSPKVLVRAPTGEFNSNSLSTNASINTKHQGQSSILNDEWDSTPDNAFAIKFLNSIGWNQPEPEPQNGGHSLCNNCNAIVSPKLFDEGCNVEELRQRSKNCDLCSLLFQTLDNVGIGPPRTITLSQDGATVRVRDGPKLLSIYAKPDANLYEGAQVGLPILPTTASDEQFSLLKQWVEACDLTHDACHHMDSSGIIMPTRLIEIGNPIKLVNSVDIAPSRYAALSHCWGPDRDSSRFCTFDDNISQLRESIDFEWLPLTFRDAITVVRALGLVDYIWIDSLCIIQDNEQDWRDEAAKMEQVFSGSYFTIAASSARSSSEGFLSQRGLRPCVQLSTKSMGRVYVCPNIDNFHRDVELGELNRRGWVLQERVLSRRTIYFSSTQIYWECGAGVHCETLARLHNSKAAFLGDANFPQSALEYYRDGRQVLVQDLYERYSGLAFTKPSDRSVALLGLQKRLERAFQTQAAFGLFSVYFARGLLWQRRDIKFMKRISWPRDRPVPSWSWVSKEGPIKYMNLQFEKIDWATKEFKNPFKSRNAVSFENQSSLKRNRDLSVLRGQARELRLTKLDMLVRISFDTEEEFDVENLRCVVIGRDKANSSPDDLKQHVLIVHPLDLTEKSTYERVGVASLRLAHVGSEGHWISIR
ncbi:hypothetical protein F5B19DRAFT_476469 [Rostrohypoxylon terebratum]|nr:hypothetical protein F5B19DRAFT_476469 [Rostrohypoxylon terebratum]